MLRDLHLAVRTLSKQPAFTGIAVLTLALGIGATSAVFSLIHGVLLTQPPYRNPEQLVLVSEDRSVHDKSNQAPAWAPLQWQDWQRNAKSLQGVAAYGWSFSYLVLEQGSQSVEGLSVTGDYFRVAGLTPLFGRTFTASETAAQPKPVIILGYNLWKNKFNADPAILGKKIRLSRQVPAEVVGVMPPGVRFLPDPSAEREPNYNVNALVDYWMPAGVDPKSLKTSEWNVLARMNSGVTLQRAQAELTALVRAQARTEPDFAGLTPQLEYLQSRMNRDGHRILWPLFGAAALVLLIACGNTASLMLVRGLQRRQEYAVRGALGISRSELFWFASVENIVVALCGGTVGVGLAFAIVWLFKLAGGHAIPRLDATGAVWPVVVCAFTAALLSAIVAGIVPALGASRSDPADVLKSTSTRMSGSRGQRTLLRAVTMGQIALTLGLLAGAELLIATMDKLAAVQPGFDVSHVLTMSVTSVTGNWGDFHHRALNRVSALPGVEHVAFAWGVPLTGNNWPAVVDIEGQPPVNKNSERTTFPLRAVTPDYFNLIRDPILEGRSFRDTDSTKRMSVVVVNKAFAERYFSGQSAVGRMLWMGGDRSAPPARIVGVVANTRTDNLTENPQPEIYASLWEASAFSKHLVVRTSSDPKTIAAAIQLQLRAINPTVAVENVKTLDEIREDSLAARIFATRLLSAFSALGTALTVIGIYGVLSLTVTARRREFAIRAAVGAQRADIRGLVFKEGFRLLAGGLLPGLISALAVGHLVRSFLFQVEPSDPTASLVVCLLFAAVVLLASWAPSRSAASTNPAETLRYE